MVLEHEESRLPKGIINFKETCIYKYIRLKFSIHRLFPNTVPKVTTKDIISTVAKTYLCNVRFMDENDIFANGEDFVRNRSVVCGREIRLGMYEDSELQLLSFFHELGHILDNRAHKTKYSMEVGAWEYAYAAAKLWGICFSIGVRVWALNQIASYKGYLKV